MYGQALTYGVLLLAFAFFLLLLGRELVAWYFKINVNLEIKREILSELKKLNGKAVSEVPSDKAA